jgi:RNA polymerase sigma factor (sigma-70 family)
MSPHNKGCWGGVLFEKGGKTRYPKSLKNSGGQDGEKSEERRAESGKRKRKREEGRGDTERSNHIGECQIGRWWARGREWASGRKERNANPGGIFVPFFDFASCTYRMDANMDDALLLKKYVDGQDQEAFADLVGRHGGWLKSAARRQLRDGQLAEDVTQAVFLLLSKRAKGIMHTRVSGWLFLAMGYCIRETKRRRMQQIAGEKEVASMRKEAVEEARWQEIAPELDEAVGKLGKADREAVLLRFYEERPLVEVGRALGISEEAAKKRVQRAVGKLRGLLAKKGITGTTAGLSAVLVGNVVEKMPEHMVERIVSAVGSGGGNTVAAGIAKGAMKMMTMAKVKVAAIMFLAVVGVGVVVAQHGPATRGAAAGTGASGNANVGQADASRDEIIRILRSARAVADQVESGRGLAEVVETTDGKTATRKLAFWFRGSASRVDIQESADGAVSAWKWFDDGTRSVALNPVGDIVIARSGSHYGYRDCGSDFHPTAMAALQSRVPMSFDGVIDNILSAESDARMTTTVDGRIKIISAYKYPEGGNKSSKVMVEIDPKQDMHIVLYDEEQLNEPWPGVIHRLRMDVTWAQKDGVWYVAEAHRTFAGNMGPAEGRVRPTQTVDLRVRIKEYEPKVPVADVTFAIEGLGAVAGTPVYDQTKGTTYRYR